MTRPSTADGIVRLPRRPADFVAPGPRPAGDGGDPNLLPQPGEDLGFLLGDWRIFQRVDGHRWSLDDLLTAWLAARLLRARPPARALDLGTGIGSVLLMTAWNFPSARLEGVEAQPLSASLARRSVAYNGAADRVTVHDGDLRAFDGAHAFDLVTGTPPYFPPGQGTESTAVQKGPCRFEHRGGVDAYAEAAVRAVAPEGLVVLCHAALHRERFLGAAAAAGLALRHVLDVAGREGKAPLVTVAAFAPPGAPRLDAAPQHEAFAVRGADQQWTAPFRAVRRDMGMPLGPA